MPVTLLLEPHAEKHVSYERGQSLTGNATAEDFDHGVSSMSAALLDDQCMIMSCRSFIAG